MRSSLRRTPEYVLLCKTIRQFKPLNLKHEKTPRYKYLCVFSWLELAERLQTFEAQNNAEIQQEINKIYELLVEEDGR